MIKIKLQKDKFKEVIFKMKITEEELNKNSIKRALMESKKIKGLYNYEIPLRYFIPITNALKGAFYFDKNSILEYLEFFDEYEEAHFVSLKATPAFMRKWRSENCPNIFKISINLESMEIKKEIAFKKNKILFK